MPALNPAFVSQGTRILPLAFGYVLGVGDKVLYITQESGELYEVHILGEGEWDGIEQFAIGAYNHFAGTLVGVPGNNPASTSILNNQGYNLANQVHFHSGAYTPIGIPVATNSLGPDQGYDVWMSVFPSVVPPQSFSGIAYYIVAGGGQGAGQPGQQGAKPTGAIGIWRSTRCRTFDGLGNVTGYGFTVNPTWHFVEATLRYKIKPQQPALAGLTAEEKACFNWDSIAAHAARNDALIGPVPVHPITSGNGGGGSYYPVDQQRPRFVGNYVFAADSTLTNIQETILRCCRSFQRINGQRIEIIGDDPRASVFLFGANHLVPGSLSLNKKNVAKSPNVFIPKYRDLNIPAVAAVQTATQDLVATGGLYSDLPINGQSPATTLVLASLNPAIGGIPFISYGGAADPGFNGTYVVNQYETDAAPTNVLVLENWNSVTSSSATTGGYIGTLDSRFSQRAPINVQHRAHQRAAGLQAPGLSQQPRLVPVEIDLGNMTYDQANRLMKFERDRSLGIDQPGWKAPMEGTVAGYLECVDSSGNALISVQEGDLITLDDWVSPEFTGVYEVMERAVSAPSNDRQGNATLGQVQFQLLEYIPDAFTDISDTPDATYQSVPGASLGFEDRPIFNAAWIMQMSPIATFDSNGNITLTIPNLQIQIMGREYPTRYANSAWTGLVPGQPYVLYVDTENIVGDQIVPLYGSQPGTLPLAINPPGRIVVLSGSFQASTNSLATGGISPTGTVHPILYYPSASGGSTS